MLKTKLKASVIHLTLSLIIVSILMAAIIYFWFPFTFIGLTDFKEIVTLIIAIDLVLGPVLTFIVYNPKKQSLSFDLSTIATVQILALSYGIHTLYQVHPVYITFAQDSYTLVAAKDAKVNDAKHKEYKISKLASGKLAYARMPEDAEKRTELAVNVLSGGADLEERVDYYEPYQNHVNDIIKKGINPNSIFTDKENKKIANDFLNKHGKSMDKYAFLPLIGSSQDAIIVIDKKTAKPVTNLHIDPWKYVQK